MEHNIEKRIIKYDRSIRRNPKSKTIEDEDTFTVNCLKPNIGCFMPGSKKFIFVNLQDQTLQFQGIILDIPKKLPFQSSCAVDRDGVYYLTGGIHEGKILQECHSFLFNQASLLLLSPMSVPRARHSMLYLKKSHSIIVVGGISELDSGKPVKTTEIYDISSGAWNTSAKMNFAAIDCTLIERDDFIYKVGGKVDEFTSSNYIERFDIKSSTWEIVGYDTLSIDSAFLRMPNKSGGFSFGSSLIIFGGMVHKVRSNSSYKIEIGKSKPTLEEWKPVPLAGAVISPIVRFKGEFYGIQDISLDIETEIEDLTKKKLVIFSDEQWEIVL